MGGWLGLGRSGGGGVVGGGGEYGGCEVCRFTVSAGTNPWYSSELLSTCATTTPSYAGPRSVLETVMTNGLGVNWSVSCHVTSLGAIVTLASREVSLSVTNGLPLRLMIGSVSVTVWVRTSPRPVFALSGVM